MRHRHNFWDILAALFGRSTKERADELQELRDEIRQLREQIATEPWRIAPYTLPHINVPSVWTTTWDGTTGTTSGGACPPNWTMTNGTGADANILHVDFLHAAEETSFKFLHDEPDLYEDDDDEAAGSMAKIG